MTRTWAQLWRERTGGGSELEGGVVIVDEAGEPIDGQWPEGGPIIILPDNGSEQTDAGE